MKFSILSATVIVPAVYSKTSGDLCRGTAERAKDGNWYCSEVSAITYRNISQAGAYNRTTSVDPRTGVCGHERVDYSAKGPLTPLFGEVSMHLRGPMNVSQLAVYQLPGEMHAMQKRNTVPFFKRQQSMRKRDMGFRTQEFIHEVHQHPSFDVPNRRISTVRSPTLATMKDESASPSDYNHSGFHGSAEVADNIGGIGTSPSTKRLDATAKRDVSPRAESDWSRVAYYTSTAPAQATGFSFLANLGDPQKSGTFDYAFGNSLSYVTSNGDRVASESLPFDGKLETSELEIAVFSDKECNQDCPYWRPDAVSHFGWTGSSKAFFIEFQMDHYQNHGTDQGQISDAPAWWFLNAAIPRILQYGNDRNNIPCSCWSTGCGEFDAFEVLGNGEDRAKSTIHRQGNLQGGDSNYFRRPVGKTMKFAVVWHYPHITALVLNDNFDLSATLSNDQMRRLVAYNPDSWAHSLFAIGD